MPLMPNFHLTKDRLQELFAPHPKLLATLITATDAFYRGVMTQQRFVAVAGDVSRKGYYERKPALPESVAIRSIMDTLDLPEQAKLRDTLSYLRSEYKRANRDGETKEQKRARYQREYYARRKREKKMDLVRVVIPHARYKEIVDALDAAGRCDLTEELMTYKVQK